MTSLPATFPPAERRPTDWRAEAMQRRTRARFASERRFRRLGLAAVLLSAAFLGFLVVAIAANGVRGFQETRIALRLDFATIPLDVTAPRLAGKGGALALAAAGLQDRVDGAARSAYGPDGAALLGERAWLTVRDAILTDPALAGRDFTLAVPASTTLTAARRGWASDDAALLRVARSDAVTTGFDRGFLTRSDATEPGSVGIWGALKGSLLTLLVTIGLAFPIGVCAATYLEEFAPRNRWTDLIEVSINNLAAVPSIIFGLLGLAFFLGTLDMPRSAPVVGGLTLALMTMPIIIIAARASLRGVPPSLREAALGLGASRVQVVFHHVLPVALPGILTGTIIGTARALGETAPLLLIGMRAFIATPPSGLLDPATVLPVQVFLWSDEVSRGFVEKTSAAIIVLLLLLLAMNGLAIYLRNRFDTRP